MTKRTLNHLFPEFLETRKGQSEANRTNYTRRLQGVLARHGDQCIQDITPGMVNQWDKVLRA